MKSYVLSSVPVGSKVIISLTVEKKDLEFETNISYIIDGKVYANPVKFNDKVISFGSIKSVISLFWYKDSDKPVCFKGVKLTTVNDKERGPLYNIIAQSAGVEVNRRNSYRVYIGLKCDSQFGANKKIHTALVKDISNTGYAVVSDEDIEIKEMELVKSTFFDANLNYQLILTGTLIRKFKTEAGKFVYGCKYIKKYARLDEYIGLKQREELQRNVETRGASSIDYEKYKQHHVVIY